MAEDKAEKAPEAAQAEAAAAGAASEETDPREELKALQEEHAALLRERDNLKQVLGRQGQELGGLRKQAAATRVSAIDYGEQAVDPTQAQEAAELADAQAREVRLSLVEFRQAHPDMSQKRFEDVVVLLNGPEAWDFAVPKKSGDGIDYRKTMERAAEHLELAEARAANAAAKKRAEELPKKKEAELARATASGTAAQAAGKTYTEADVAKMSSQEMIDAGLVEVDPNDPLVRPGPVVQR